MRAMSSFIGVHSVARIHDYLQITFDKVAGSSDSWLRSILNVPAMLPAAAISYGGLMNGNPVLSSLAVDKKL